MRTLQQAYNIAKQHIKDQGSRAYDNNARQCLYRTSDGRACAVGALLPDLFEGLNSRGTVEGLHYGYGLRFWDAIDMKNNIRTLEFLKDLQKAHDSDLSEPYITSWEEEVDKAFAQVALAWGLNP